MAFFSSTRFGIAVASLAAIGATLTPFAAQAQYNNFGSGYRQPAQQGLIQPSRNEGSYQLQQPLNRQPDFNQPRQLPNQRGFGHSSGSYFGW